MGDAVIVSACRTAVGDASRSVLGRLPIEAIGRVPVGEALQRSGIAAEEVDDLVLGEVMHGGGAVSRYIAVDTGLTHVPGMATQRHCASGLAAVTAAAADIRAGMHRVAIAGGVENMTRTPVTHQRSPEGLVPWTSLTHPETPGAPAMVMGITVGENTAEECAISREEQDAWAYRSHTRAVAAIDGGRFDDELVPVEVEVDGDTVVFDTDAHPRRDTSLEKLAALPPAFREGGTVTAGNSSSLNDGAAAVVLTDADYATANGLEPLAVLRSWAYVGVEPRRTGLGPTEAVPRALARADLTTADIDLVELNEAFASMAVACTRVLDLDEDAVNVNGGAIALGHPVAATGAKLLVTLVHELRRRGGGNGLVTMCAGGGMGAAVVVEVLPPRR